MDLRLDASLGAGYVSRSQVARRMTEPWAERNLFCPACPSNRLDPLANNTAVLDLRCPRCNASYQLKSKATPFGRKVSNSAYASKMAAIAKGDAPHYAFLQYDPLAWTVKALFVIPGYFFTPAIVERRNPLGPGTRRAGWIGSNILLHALPPEARVIFVADGSVRRASQVRSDWKRFAFLKQGARGGWSADVLSCVRRMQQQDGRPDFHLRDFYARFETELAARHPENRHVKDKIRQQLQVLRDGGVLEFLTPGQYRIVG